MQKIPKNRKILKNDGHFRIPHPQTSLKQFSNICEIVVYFFLLCRGVEKWLTLIKVASQLLQKAGLVGEFSPTTVVPSPPQKNRAATSWRFFSNWYKPLLCVWLEIFLRCSGPFSFRFFAIFAMKTKLFWSSYKIQKDWPYNLRPIPEIWKNI